MFSKIFYLLSTFLFYDFSAFIFSSVSFYLLSFLSFVVSTVCLFSVYFAIDPAQKVPAIDTFL